MKLRKTVILADHRKEILKYGNRPFEVESLTGSIEFEIGSFLAAAEVTRLLDSPHWKVIVKKPKR